jgi:replication factor A2
VGAHVIRPIEDHNEINLHLLEATYVHLYFTRGPPESLQSGGAAAGGGNGMFVDGPGAGAGQMGGAKQIPSMTPTARKVYMLLQSAPQNNEGLHVQMISSKSGIPINEVYKAGDELLSKGLIYTTIDDETWAILEY